MTQQATPPQLWNSAPNPRILDFAYAARLSPSFDGRLAVGRESVFIPHACRSYNQTMSSYSGPAIAAPSAKPRHSRSLLHSVGFTCALALLFLRFSDLHEMIASMTHTSNYVLYIFGPLALVAALLSGRFVPVLRQNPSRFWLGFVVWMVLAVPLSSWRGGSFTHVMSYVKANFILLLITACLATKWSDCKKIIYVIAAAALCNMAAAYLFFTPSGERLDLQWSGTIGNSNDLAGHLLFVLPFLLFVALKPATPVVFRIVSAVAVSFGVFLILRTASRGALIALVVTILFLFIRGSARQKLAVGAIAVIAFIVLTRALPEATWTRLISFFQKAGASEEALQSSELREYALRQSIIYTFKHPLFGVGPQQFPNYEGRASSEEGVRGAWKETHNSYTQISSECGIPALIFYLAALFSTFAFLSKIRKNAVGPHRREIATAAYCITIALVAYSVAAFFLNFGYQFHLLAISGLVVAMWSVVCKERRRLQSSTASPPPTPAASPELEPLPV